MGVPLLLFRQPGEWSAGVQGDEADSSWLALLARRNDKPLGNAGNERAYRVGKLLWSGRFKPFGVGYRLTSYESWG